MPYEYPYTQSLFRKSGYLHVGEIYTSKVVGLKPHKKIPPHVWLYTKMKLSSGQSRYCVFNTHAYFFTIENAHLTTSVNKHLYSKQVSKLVPKLSNQLITRL